VLTDLLDRKLSSKRSRFAAAALALSLLLPAGRAAAQSDEDKAAARVLATQGAEALGGSKYGEALDLVSRAEQMFHAPTHLLLIARAQVGLGRLVAAKESYLKLTREELAAGAPSAFKRAQQEGKDEVAALDSKIASLRIAVEGGGQQKFTVKMDDQPVSPALLGVYHPVDPGKHEIIVYPVGQGPVKGAIDLKDGEKKDLKLTIPDVVPGGVPVNPIDNPDAVTKPDPGKDKIEPAGPGFFTPLRGAGIGAAVLGASGVVVGALFLTKGSATQSDADLLQDACVKPGSSCTKTQREAIHALDVDAAGKKTIALVGFVAGGVALAAGVTMIVLGKPKAKASGATVTPWFTGDAGGVRGTF
jgi:hypothetical protein